MPVSGVWYLMPAGAGAAASHPDSDMPAVRPYLARWRVVPGLEPGARPQRWTIGVAMGPRPGYFGRGW